MFLVRVQSFTTFIFCSLDVCSVFRSLCVDFWLLNLGATVALLLLVLMLVRRLPQLQSDHILLNSNRTLTRNFGPQALQHRLKASPSATQQWPLPPPPPLITALARAPQNHRSPLILCSHNAILARPHGHSAQVGIVEEHGWNTL